MRPLQRPRQCEVGPGQRSRRRFAPGTNATADPQPAPTCLSATRERELPTTTASACADYERVGRAAPGRPRPSFRNTTGRSERPTRRRSTDRSPLQHRATGSRRSRRPEAARKDGLRGDTIALSADVAQLVEHRHGKAGVKGSSPFVGSRFVPQRHRSSVPFLSTVVLSCPQGEDGKSPVQESNMALYLEIGRPWGNAMVRRGSGVRVPASASLQIGFSKRFLRVLLSTYPTGGRL